MGTKNALNYQIGYYVPFNCGIIDSVIALSHSNLRQIVLLHHYLTIKKVNKFQDLDILRKTDLTVEEVKSHPAFAKLPETQIEEIIITIKTITEIAFNFNDISKKRLGKNSENL